MTGGVQGEIRKIQHEGRECVVKSPRGGILKSISGWMLGREGRIYEKLEGVDGIPKCFGMTEGGLLLEAVDGRVLSEYRRGEISVEFLDRLDALIAAIHQRGVVHSDLKKRANIMVVEREQGTHLKTEGGQAGNPGGTPFSRREQLPVILDFGAAFAEGEILYETFRRVDLAAVAKLRAHHQPQTLRADQKNLLENPTWAERLSRVLIRTVRDPFRYAAGRIREKGGHGRAIHG